MTLPLPEASLHVHHDYNRVGHTNVVSFSNMVIKKANVTKTRRTQYRDTLLYHSLTSPNTWLQVQRGTSPLICHEPNTYLLDTINSSCKILYKPLLTYSIQDYFCLRLVSKHTSAILYSSGTHSYTSLILQLYSQLDIRISVCCLALIAEAQV